MLFNRDNNGSAEIQAVTGTFSASSDYSVISPEVDDAERAVRHCVGDEVVDEAASDYQAGVDNPLVAKVQLPVAALAMLRLSRLTLVSHDTRGGKVRTDGDEQLPYAWMVDRDERAQQERYYRAMDALYQYLTESGNEDFLNFRATRGESSIVRTLDEFERVYPIDGSYYVFYMLQNLIIEEQPRVRNLIGEDRWSHITDDDNWELLALCRRYLVLSAVVTAVERWSLAAFPLEVARRFAPSYQGSRANSAATEEEMDNYIGKLRRHILEAESRIASLLAGGANPWADYDTMPRSDRADKFFSAQ